MTASIVLPNNPMFGIDIGGILAPDLSVRIRTGDGGFVMPLPAPHSLEVLRTITERYGNNRQAILSRITPGPNAERARQANLQFIEEYGYAAAMGITRPELVRVYIGEREEKGKVHAPELGINVMVDDRVECLENMDPGVTLVVMNPKEAISEFQARLSGHRWHRVHDWLDFAYLLGLPDNALY